MFQTDKAIALAIQTKLNTLSTTLYTAETIDKQIVFKVASNFDEYYKITEMEYTINSPIKYTPVLLQKTASTLIDDTQSGFYSESYQLIIYGFQIDKDALEIVLSEYVEAEVTTDRENMASYVVKKKTSAPRFLSLHGDGSGDNLKRVSYEILFTWNYTLGGIISDDVTVTIDGTAVNYVQLGYTTDKLSIANVAYGANTTPLGATGFVFSVTLPIQIGNTKHQSLFTDLMNKSYNKSYSVSVAFSTFYTMSYTMTLKRGSVNFQRDQIVSFTLEFEEALARTTVTVDSVALPVLSFVHTQDIAKGDGLDVGFDAKYKPTGAVKSWTIRFAYDSSVAKNKELLENILVTTNYNTTYTLGITISGITAKTYSVMLHRGTYNFEQTGELTYECVFVEKVT